MLQLPKKLFIVSLFLIGSMVFQTCTGPSREKSDDYPYSPVDFTQVKLNEGYWRTWVETARNSTIPYAFEKCEETGRIDNFIFAGQLREGKFRGRFGFDDSDVYKIMEGAAYGLMLEDDPFMEAYLDSLVSYVASAQEQDGYLYTSWTLKANEYTDFVCCSYDDRGQWIGTPHFSHEFYNVGHMYEAAVAHYLATGKRPYLDVAIMNAGLIYDVCITQGKDYVPGHQEIEIGLIKLYRVSGEKKYLDLAKHLLDIRAEAHEGEYAQAHLPVTQQSEAVGHAVRANYMYSAMADVAALTGDSAYLAAIGRIWENVVQKKLSVTGGVGASRQGEAYGQDYELPNDPYNETCAAIANVYWNHRMFLLHGDAKYIDVLERSLYNGVMSGLSMEGTRFFYPNTLRHDGKGHFNRGSGERSPWFDCSCCPSNLSRFVPSVAAYAYAQRRDEVYVNLYLNSEVTIPLENGTLNLIQQSNYPWDGNIRIEFGHADQVEATIRLRIPGWIRNQPVPSDLFCFSSEQQGKPTLHVNGEVVEMDVSGAYVAVSRAWKKGDVIQLVLPMEVRTLRAHALVEDKEGLTAIQYGPIVYCAEEIDNEQDVIETLLDKESDFDVKFRPDLLGGVNVLEGGGFKLVPYYAWANRKVGKMNVWFKSN